MLPRIVMFKGKREDALERLGVSDRDTIVYEGSQSNVKDFRHWINSTVETLKGRSNYTAIVWDAHLLSWECQAVLLKPLEEMGEAMQILLIVDDPNMLSETILSRCSVEDMRHERTTDIVYWTRVTRCWREGPAACMALSDSLSQEEALLLAEEVARKMRGLLREEINPKRVEILRRALVLAEEMRARNLNVKLCLGEFLLTGWQLGKT